MLALTLDHASSPLRAPILDHMKVVCSRHTFPEYIIVRDTRKRDIVIAGSLKRRFAQKGFLKLRNAGQHIEDRLSFDSRNSCAADMLEINDEVTDCCCDTLLFFSVKVSPKRTMITKANDLVFETQHAVVVLFAHSKTPGRIAV